MQEIRVCLKGRSEPGAPTMSRKEANRIWREEILGIKSEDQKKADKEYRKSKNKKYQEIDLED